MKNTLRARNVALILALLHMSFYHLKRTNEKRPDSHTQ
jgi:hypothetical protein